ncbi:heavy metal sensor histidine kinase [Chitinimonas arctica]|uniref:Sensor protein n=1 Tax=Chitinimonas arctica TaxID=2594795 RepID=A0A516SLQ8_9NEIS|nr:heavy metal sensor histidine kinase [Chitinimonas arctica]QDQ29091.1 heavy metal sensor histidine kinase [Chitinimonas arctica]
MKRGWMDTDSVAFHLVGLFTLGSALILLGVGYTLYHALAMQVEARDRAEIDGKAKVVRHILMGIARPEQLATHAAKIAEIKVGHPHLSLGIRTGGIWLLRPSAVIANRLATSALPAADRIETFRIGDEEWWVRRIAHRWPGISPAEVDVYVAVDITDSQRLLRQHRDVAMLAGLLGVMLSGMVAYLVTRRSLLPLGLLAKQAGQLTADRLGAPLDVAQAPTEVRGLVESLNGMLSRLNSSFRSLEQFSADIAHELRTPLNNLMLQTQVTLSRDRDVQSYVEALHSNLEELERMQRMVTDMLFVARADRGLLTLAQGAVDLRQEAESVVEYFELAASEKAQSIKIHGELTVPGDRLMLRRVLTNLLSNAVRYSPAGAAIQLTLRNDPDRRELTVSNPVGQMVQGDLLHLFARFTRGNPDSQRDTDGVGLGLAIVDSIVRLHKGKVSVKLERGAILFCVHFPH